MRKKPELGEVAKPGKILAVCGAKGGVGRTAVAVNLAIALSKNKQTVVILDGNFQFGDIGLALNLQTAFTIKDAADRADSLDRFTLSGFLANHSSGVKILTSPQRPEHAELITIPVLEKALTILQEEFDYIIIDCPTGFQETGLYFLENAANILAVSTMELTSIRNTQLMLETLDSLGLTDKVQIILNRTTMDSTIKLSDVEKLFHGKDLFHVPNQFQIVSKSLNLGLPFVITHPNSDIAKAIFKMAEKLHAGEKTGKTEPSHFTRALMGIFAKGRR